MRGYVTVNPNYTAHALGEIGRGLTAGMIGIKLAASRRADDPLLDPICHAGHERWPMLGRHFPPNLLGTSHPLFVRSTVEG